MKLIVYFFWMCEQTISGLSFMPVVSLVLLTALVISFVINNPFARKRYHRRNWLALLPALIPVAILIIGTIFRDQSGTTPASWAQHITTGLAAMHIPLAILLVLKLKEIRLFSTMMVLFMSWFTYWAWILSAMSIWGDWI